MSEFRKVIQFGKSLAITLPVKIISALNIKAGDNMRVDLVNNRIVLSVVKTDEFLKLGQLQEVAET